MMPGRSFISIKKAENPAGVSMVTFTVPRLAYIPPM
jgi:hypothetical protein